MFDGMGKNREIEAGGGNHGTRVKRYTASVRIRRPGLVFALLGFFFCASLAIRDSSLPFAQQPQAQQGQPLMALNAKYVNGVAPGYWPTSGTGLTLNLAAGTSVCGNSQVSYTGGTLTLAASATNYVYLDMTNNCVPASTSSASAFPSTGVPLAVVTTGATSITAISDARTWFAARPAVDPGGQVYNVRAYGATGNGSTDDTAAIQSVLNNWCVNNVKTGVGGQVYFPVGTYKISSPLVSCGEGVRLVGESTYQGSGAQLLWAGAAGQPMLILYGAFRNTIEHLGFNTGTSNYASPAIWLAADNSISTTLGTAVTSPGSVTVTPGSMSQIATGVLLGIDNGTANAELVIVTATTGSTFTATFAKTHTATATVGGSFVVEGTRIDHPTINQNGTGDGIQIGDASSAEVAETTIIDPTVVGSTGNTGSGIHQTAGNNTGDVWIYAPKIFSFAYGVNFGGCSFANGIIGGNLEGITTADIYPNNNCNLTVQNVYSEPGSSDMFISQNGIGSSSLTGSLTLIGNQVAPLSSSTYLIQYYGHLAMTGNSFGSANSSVKIQCGTLVGNNAASCSSRQNFYQGASGWAPIYDSSNNALLPTYYGHQPVSVESVGDMGGTQGSKVSLSSYVHMTAITDDSQSTVAGTGVVRTGNTGCALGWRNNAGSGDVTLCKNSSDQVGLNRPYTFMPASLPIPTSTTLGGVMANTGSTGQFVNGINSSGQLTYGTPAGSGTVTSITPGTGLNAGNQSAITTSGTLSVDCDPLNVSVVCYDEEFPATGSTGTYGWGLSNVGGSGSSIDITTEPGSQTWFGFISRNYVETPATLGYGAWYQLTKVAWPLGNNVNWDSHFYAGGGTGMVFRVGYATEGATIDVPANGFYARYDPSLSTPDTAVMVCSDSSSTETCASTGLTPSASYDVRIRAISSGEVGITVGSASEMTICASGCTVTATPTTAALTPSFECLSNTASTAELLQISFWRFKAWTLSR